MKCESCGYITTQEDYVQINEISNTWKCPSCKRIDDIPEVKKTPPKDKHFIATCWMGTSICVWSEPDNAFVFASPQTDIYDGEWNMKYFENEHIEEKDITEWREI